MVFETKCYADDPHPSIGMKQLAEARVDRTLTRMQKEGGKLADGLNPEIARQAQEEGVDRYLVHVGYRSETIRIYKVDASPDGSLSQTLVREGTMRDAFSPMEYGVNFGFKVT